MLLWRKWDRSVCMFLSQPFGFPFSHLTSAADSYSNMNTNSTRIWNPNNYDIQHEKAVKPEDSIDIQTHAHRTLNHSYMHIQEMNLQFPILHRMWHTDHRNNEIRLSRLLISSACMCAMWRCATQNTIVPCSRVHASCVRTCVVRVYCMWCRRCCWCRK